MQSEDKAEVIPHVILHPSRSGFLRKFFIDVSSIVLLLVPILCLFLWGEPLKRGFNCNDDSIRYPYKDNTITSVTLYFYSTLIPIFIISVNELVVIRYSATSNQFAGWQLSNSNSFLRCYIWQVYLQLVPLAFAAVSSQLVTDISKYSIGRLRPHFLDRCHPKLPDGQVLDRFSNCDNPYAYVIDYTCTSGLSNRKLRDSHLSFMSGHSSFAAVCLVYLVIYIQNRVRWTHLGLLKSLVQALLLCLVLYTGFSRISDYKHHWSDVLTGLIQGTLTATLVAFFVSDLVKPQNYVKVNRPNSIAGTSNPDPESGV